MESIKFNPQIFTVELSDSNNSVYVNLLTLDGEDPNNTVYILDNPSSVGGYNAQLDEKLENEEWEVSTLQNSDLELSDFEIDPEEFNQAGYEFVYAELMGALSTYTIEFARYEQDNVNFIPVYTKILESVMEANPYHDFDYIVKHSIKEGLISSLEEAKTFCDGGDSIEPYFTTNTPAEECSTYVEYYEEWVCGLEWEEGEEPEFDTLITNYKFFQE